MKQPVIKTEKQMRKFGHKYRNEWALVKCKHAETNLFTGEVELCNHVFSYAHWSTVDEWGHPIGYYCPAHEKYAGVHEVLLLGYDEEKKHLSAYPVTAEVIELLTE